MYINYSKYLTERSVEQSDQDLHCLPVHLHLLDTVLHCESCFISRTFKVFTCRCPNLYRMLYGELKRFLAINIQTHPYLGL